MKSLVFKGFVFASILVACDPDLTPIHIAGDAGEAGAAPGTPSGAGGGGAASTGSAAPNDAGDAGSNAESEGGAEAGASPHVIDGTNDFKAGEKLPTSSTKNGYEGFVAWDDTNLYFGMAGTDVGSGSADRWVLVYISGTSGTTTGLNYGGVQEPTLPFAAGYHLRWKVKGDYTNGQRWTGTGWVDGASAGVVPVAAHNGTFMEMSVPRSALGNPSTVKIHMTMIKENGADWTYAAVPSTSITDGVDPDYTKYLEFDLSDATKTPSQYSPKP